MLSDFDGTLAPIVADPDEAVPHPGAVEVLGSLAQRYARVAVISGRPLAWLSARLAGAAAEGVELIGLYGLERSGRDPLGSLDQLKAVEAAAAEADRAAPPGVLVERKGLSFTLHYRQAPEHGAWVEAEARQLAARHGLRVHPGKMSVELRPESEVDKGRVVEELAAGMAAVCYLGDDVADVPAFAALGRLRRRRVVTAAIAVAGHETPPELLALADQVVEGVEGALGLLRELARFPGAT